MLVWFLFAKVHDIFTLCIPAQGILSTERGQQSLFQLDSYERSLVEV